MNEPDMMQLDGMWQEIFLILFLLFWRDYVDNNLPLSGKSTQLGWEPFTKLSFYFV